jgi:hypothetical protein
MFLSNTRSKVKLDACWTPIMEKTWVGCCLLQSWLVLQQMWEKIRS